MLGACNVLAYASAICIFLMGLCRVTTLAAILLSAPEALSIARAFNPSWTPWQSLLGGKTPSKGSGEGGGSDKHQRQRPYRLEGLVVRILKHAPGVLLAVFADTILREVIAAGTAAAATAAADDGRGVAGSSYWGAWLSGVADVLFSTSLPVRCLPLVPFVYIFFLSSPRPRPPPPPSPATEAKKQAGVVVAGGGVGGLVLGACLQELGLPFEVKTNFRRLRRFGWIHAIA